MREWENERMREWENERMREWENEGISKWGTSYKLVPKEINFAKVSNFGKVYTPKSDTSETSEDNGEERKRVEKNFDEKRLWEGWG